MSKIPFTYREFYDVPRMIVCTVKNTRILMDSIFNRTTDEYDSEYTIYELPEDIQIDTMISWGELSSLARRTIGTLPVKSLEFDSSKRKQLDDQILIDLL